MTHDSIGLGEDGPTHQPVEHLAALRAIPNHLVFRPADAVETAECWQIGAGIDEDAVDPGADPPEPAGACAPNTSSENLSAKGAYELAAADGEAEVTIFATGSEVEIALDARDLLAGARPLRRASSRCRASNCSRSRARPTRQKVLGNAPVKVAIEAGIRLGWDRFIGSDGIFIGMTRLRRQRHRPRSSTSISASPPRRDGRRRAEAAAARSEPARRIPKRAGSTAV